MFDLRWISRLERDDPLPRRVLRGTEARFDPGLTGSKNWGGSGHPKGRSEAEETASLDAEGLQVTYLGIGAGSEGAARRAYQFGKETDCGHWSERGICVSIWFVLSGSGRS